MSLRRLPYLSRRDNRTKPGVLTPGLAAVMTWPEGAEEDQLHTSRSPNGAPRRFVSLRVQPEIPILVCVQPLRSAAPSGQVRFCIRIQGLKPLAESYYPFGISTAALRVDTPIRNSTPGLDS